MRLKANAEGGYSLRGKLTGLKTIHGHSAYEVAVINGFVGTEEEWLHSLVGRPGAQGAQGAAGVSPTAEVTAIVGGYRVTITDNDGIHSFDLYHGIKAEYDEETQTLYIVDGGSEGGMGTPGVGILSVEQTTTSEEDGGINEFTVTLTNGNKTTFRVRNGTKGSSGEKGDKGDRGATGATGATGAAGVGISSASYANGFLTFHKTDGNATQVQMPQTEPSVDSYSKEEIDTMFGSYVDDIAEIVGGDA